MHFKIHFMHYLQEMHIGNGEVIHLFICLFQLQNYLMDIYEIL